MVGRSSDEIPETRESIIGCPSGFIPRRTAMNVQISQSFDRGTEEQKKRTNRTNRDTYQSVVSLTIAPTVVLTLKLISSPSSDVD